VRVPVDPTASHEGVADIKSNSHERYGCTIRVASVIVYTPGADPDPTPCTASLLPQVDEPVVVVNGPGAAPEPLEGVRALRNEYRLGFSANLNRGVAATDAELIVVANPDTEARPRAIAALRDFAEDHPRAGILGPQLLYPDGSWQPSRRRFPTVSGTLVRRTPLRLVVRPYERQRSHYMLDAPPDQTTPVDWLLGAFLMVRRTMLEQIGGFDEGFRLYGEDIDICYRAAKAGWERWYVPDAIVRHRWAAITDHRFLTRRTLWHWRSMLRFVRKHPEGLVTGLRRG
jgi:GT2 family glycosyltransferase